MQFDVGGDLIKKIAEGAKSASLFLVDRSSEEKEASARRINAEAKKMEQELSWNILKLLLIGFIIGLFVGSAITWGLLR